jgi:hypothetical protein
MVCVPCLAAAGPPGIAAAAVGTVGYGAYKYISPQKKIKRGKKRTKRKSKRGKKGGGKQDKFKRGEIVRFVTNDGKKQKMKFVKNVPPNKISIKFPNAKKYNPILTVNGDKIEKIPKNIANTKHRQRTRRAALVRKKRGIKTKSTTKSSTLELPNSDSNSDNVDNLLKNMKI